jgi:ethanolamine ammonia-lyase large subunit
VSDATSLRQAFALANAFKEGDLAIGGTTDDRLRQDARGKLLATSVADIRRARLVDDSLSEALERTRHRRDDADLDALTLDRLKAILLSARGAAWAHAHCEALPSEVIAGIAKVMTNDELSTVARTLFNPLPGHGVCIGDARHFGSRIQPNSPGDDEDEILFSILEGLSFGCGDVIIGLNPAADEVDEIVRLEHLLERVVERLALPTRYCVLSDMVKQREAQARARVDVGFQSLAGTAKALMGIIGLDVDALVDLAGHFDGLYFETGQGSEVTNGSAEGVDMVTLESRTYGAARHIRRQASEGRRERPWMIVNDVAGFIGPEVFTTGEQLERACLEDSVMAKLHGLTMGLDVCATFHMGIAPGELRTLTSRIVENAAPAYLMAVAGNADPMLGYLTTSFREHPELRSASQRRITTAMDRRLLELGIPEPREGRAGGDGTARLYAHYAKVGGDEQTADALMQAGTMRVQRLRERGFDLGERHGAQSHARVDRIYGHSRAALYAMLDESVLRDAGVRAVRVRTRAVDRDDYLAHPLAGECLRDDDARTASRVYSARAPQVQVIISDGLNANAVNEHLRALLPALRRRLIDAGCHIGEADIVVQNGRVRVGYEIGGLVNADVVIHLIGERPGTGLNTLSAYVTYGRDRTGQFRWSRALDHSLTNAICGIHPNGKRPEAAAAEVGRTVSRILEQRWSGVGHARPSPTR